MATTARSDVAIIGGGLVGGALALILAQLGVQVTVFDRVDLTAPPPVDHRTTAISFGSAQVLDKAGVWKKLLPGAQPIEKILIRDGAQELWFDHSSVRTEPMGHIVANSDLRQALRLALVRQKNLRLATPAEITSIAADDFGVTVTLAKSQTTRRATLAIIADGRRSVWREKLGFITRRHDYRASAVIANIGHAYPHHKTAYECFLPAGPLALLPMRDYRAAPQSSLVWTEPTARAEALMTMSDDDFCALLADRFGDDLGEFRITGPRQIYPLDVVAVTHPCAKRAVVIGDAAHGIHPIAGQGLNLGLRDVAQLAETLGAAQARGLDIGSAVILADYARRRQFDVGSMIGATHGLNWLFGQTRFGVPKLRRLGLALVDSVPGLKPQFIKRAMGDF